MAEDPAVALDIVKAEKELATDNPAGALHTHDLVPAAPNRASPPREVGRGLVSVALAIEGAVEVHPGPSPPPARADRPRDRARFLRGAPRSIALLGPSGRGTTTLLSPIAGLEPATLERIAIDERAEADPQTAIAILFRSPVPVDRRDPLGNVLLRADPCGRDRRALEPGGARAPALGRARDVSGAPTPGTLGRHATARALPPTRAHDPPLVANNERPGALVAMTRAQPRTDLERLWMRTGTIVPRVTHSIEEAAQLADRVLVISPRPGWILRDLALPPPRPRTPGTLAEIGLARSFATGFGFGYRPERVVGLQVYFFPLVFGGILAFASVLVALARLCRATRAGRWRTVRHVRLPAAAPRLFVGIEGAAVNASVGATLAEWIGDDAGLGSCIAIATGDLRMDPAFTIILVLAALGLAPFCLVVPVERLLIPWHASRRLWLGARPEG